MNADRYLYLNIDTATEAQEKERKKNEKIRWNIWICELCGRQLPAEWLAHCV